MKCQIPALVIACTVLVCGVKHSVNLVKRNTVDNEEELISYDYSNDPRCVYSGSLEHMLRSLEIQTLGVRYKVLPQRARKYDNQIIALGTFRLIVLIQCTSNVSTY